MRSTSDTSSGGVVWASKSSGGAGSLIGLGSSGSIFGFFATDEGDFFVPDFLVVLPGLLAVVLGEVLGRVRLAVVAVRLVAVVARVAAPVVRVVAPVVRVVAAVVLVVAAVVLFCSLLALADRGLEEAVERRVVVAPLRGDVAGLLVLAPEDVGRVDIVLLA